MRQLSAIANLEPVSRSFSENGSQMANLNKPVPQYFIRPTLFTDLIIQKRLRCEFAQFRVRWSLRERRIDKILERSNRSTRDCIIATDATRLLVAKDHQVFQPGNRNCDAGAMKSRPNKEISRAARCGNLSNFHRYQPASRDKSELVRPDHC